MPQCPTRKHWKSFSLPLFLSPPLCLFHSLSACLLASYVKKRAVHLIKNKVNKIQAKPVRHNIPHIPLWGWMHASVNCKISSFLRVARYVFLSHKALKEKKIPKQNNYCFTWWQPPGLWVLMSTINNTWSGCMCLHTCPPLFPVSAPIVCSASQEDMYCRAATQPTALLSLVINLFVIPVNQLKCRKVQKNGHCRFTRIQRRVLIFILQRYSHLRSWK